MNSFHLEYTHIVVNSSAVKWPSCENSPESLLPLGSREIDSASTATGSKRNLSQLDSFPKPMPTKRKSLGHRDAYCEDDCLNDVAVLQSSESYLGTSDLNLTTEGIKEGVIIGHI